MSCEKVKYRKKKDAQYILNSLVDSGRWNKKEVVGRIYYCFPCDGWHITHVEEKPETDKSIKLVHKKKWKKLLKKSRR